MCNTKARYFEAFGAGACGKVRKRNEDNLYLDGKFPTQEQLSDLTSDILIEGDRHAVGDTAVYAVFDGMGGEQEGDKASAIAVRIFSELCGSGSEPNITEMLERANDDIVAYTYERILRRCGTTAAVVVVTGGMVRAFNVGDSRVYLCRKGKIRQLSEDHTQAQMLVNANVLTKEEAAQSPARHRLLQHLGMDKEEQAISVFSAKEFKLLVGDRLLICSDGVYEMVSDTELCCLLSEDDSARNIAVSILGKAMDAGGVDNTTAIVIKAER